MDDEKQKSVVDYRLNDVHKLDTFFSELEADHCALMGTVRCIKCQEEHRAIMPIPDWALSPAGLIECTKCGEMGCVFIYDHNFRRIISSRQERDGWDLSQGECTRKEVRPPLRVIQEEDE